MTPRAHVQDYAEKLLIVFATRCGPKCSSKRAFQRAEKQPGRGWDSQRPRARLPGRPEPSRADCRERPGRRPPPHGPLTARLPGAQPVRSPPDFRARHGPPPPARRARKPRPAPPRPEGGTADPAANAAAQTHPSATYFRFRGELPQAPRAEKRRRQGQGGSRRRGSTPEPEMGSLGPELVGSGDRAAEWPSRCVHRAWLRGLRPARPAAARARSLRGRRVGAPRGVGPQGPPRREPASGPRRFSPSY
nr:basic salivary proline-rich protein 3-like [Equus asinus]